jgi:hypothetical protein
MFWYKCNIFWEIKMPVLKTICYWRAVIYEVLQSIVSFFLVDVIKYEMYNCTDL